MTASVRIITAILDFLYRLFLPIRRSSKWKAFSGFLNNFWLSIGLGILHPIEFGKHIRERRAEQKRRRDIYARTHPPVPYKYSDPPKREPSNFVWDMIWMGFWEW